MHIELDAHTSLEDLREFLAGNPQGTVPGPGRKQACEHIGRVLRRFSYWKLGKADKGLLRRYLARTTGLSRAQLARLIRRYLADGELRDRRGRAARPFPRKYTRADILLLAATDELHGSLSGPATLALLKRAWEGFGDARYQRLAGLSNGHPYNLRRSQPYVLRRGRKEPARPSPVAIGERRKPRPEGLPGWVRVDSVQQGGQDKVKGVYHINVVDEVTQYQFSGSVERSSEHFLLPAPESLLEAFPFRVRGFHSDNGSEYVNCRVAALLEKLRVQECTKSRPRRSNDNALAESKNGTVIRKHFGYGHIPGRQAERLHAFHRDVLAPHLNYHRPCYFPSEQVDAWGRVRKRYRQQDIMTPCQKLRSLPGAADCLRPGIDFAQLDALAGACSDNEAARRLNQARDKLFATIRAEQAGAA